MRLVDRIDKYLEYNDFKIVITDDLINIVNYKEIESFSSSLISIRCNNGVINIVGIDLIISKMLSDEVEVMGKFKSITYV